MRAALPTDLLLRLMNATPEQYAAVAKILGASADCGMRSAECSSPHPQSLGTPSPPAPLPIRLGEGGVGPVEAEMEESVSEDVAHELSGLRRDVAAMRKAIRDMRHMQTSEPVSDNEAARVFALMKSLDAGDRTRKAPLERVFRLLVLEGHSQDAVAMKCQCSAGLVSLRVTEIERRMQRPLEQLRALATKLGSMDMPVDDSRARAIYRRGLTDDTGTEDENE